jgi:hypothetical protein
MTNIKLSPKAPTMAEVGALETVPALFQTGYLTVDKIFHDDFEGSTLSLNRSSLGKKKKGCNFQ